MFSANAVTSIKDVQELITLRAKLTEAGVQNALGYSRGVYEIASEAQADFSALAEEAWASYTKGVAAWVEKATKNAPAGSDVAVTALKSTVAATTAPAAARVAVEVVARAAAAERRAVGLPPTAEHRARPASGQSGQFVRSVGFIKAAEIS